MGTPTGCRRHVSTAYLESVPAVEVWIQQLYVEFSPSLLCPGESHCCPAGDTQMMLSIWRGLMTDPG
jgi:hypothetical protein